MDSSMWVDHVVSILFGSAGGIAAGLSRISSALSSYDKRLTALEQKIAVDSSGFENELRHIQDRLDKLCVEIEKQRTTLGDHQIEVQRVLGGIEGTLHMLSRNGCGRACSISPGRSSISDGNFPSVEMPTRNKR
jgi:hypothetical protein